jgi:rfaE bifunctional protein kinase chain/domain
MKNLIKQVNGFVDREILVIGDTIIDINTMSKVIGFSAETPTIKAEETKRLINYGGSANVVKHILELGAKCTFISVAGNDEDYNTLEKWSHPNLSKIIIAEKDRKTCVKHRFWIEKENINYKHFQINKTDRNDILPETKEAIIGAITKTNFDRVIFSDYRLGMFKDLSFIRKLVTACRGSEIYANGQLSDGKLDYSKFKDVDLIIMNNDEANSVTDWHDTSDIIRILNSCTRLLGADVCITLGKNGSIIKLKEAVVSEPAVKVKSVDTCGAGDAFLACLSLCDSGLELSKKLKLSNTWAGLTTQLMGTSTPDKDTLIKKISDF